SAVTRGRLAGDEPPTILVYETPHERGHLPRIEQLRFEARPVPHGGDMQIDVLLQERADLGPSPVLAEAVTQVLARLDDRLHERESFVLRQFWVAVCADEFVEPCSVRHLPLPVLHSWLFPKAQPQGQAVDGSSRGMPL